ncbi:MAG: excinuclease ABC subunit UvrB [Candidatus Pacebacteria bacterium]|nr:excinuclease ABC subunit UvrB [Candidatus Paceibacterota bacterium]
MFELVAKFKPAGDQPQAIDALTKNILAGKEDQVLLGVTGSGKSVIGETPVFIKQNGKVINCQIGPFIDGLFKKYSNLIKQKEGTEILTAGQIKKELFIETFSLSPETKTSEWRPITQLIRHRSPKNLFHVKTKCGREVITTGDHNFFILRHGKFILVPTEKIKNIDHIPLPIQIETSKNDLAQINILKILKNENLFVDAKPFILKALLSKKPAEIAKAMEKHFVFPWQKLYQIKSGRYRGIPFLRLCQIAEDLNINLADEEIKKIVIGSQIHSHTLPAKLSLTKEWLMLFGYYLAEGHGEVKSRFFTITAEHQAIRKQLERIFRKLKLNPYRKINDFSIGSKIHTTLLVNLMGSKARTKKLPHFWPNLSQKQLAVVLKAYFDGDGGAFEKQKQIIAPTASKQLASDLAYALARFGIWARINKSWNRATNSPSHKGSYYWYLVISGYDNVKKFKKYIGFDVPEKQKRLLKLLDGSSATNVDVIPDVGPVIKTIRKKIGISQKTLAEKCKLSQGTINAIEIGANSPRRKTFELMTNGLLTLSPSNKEIQDLKSLLNCKWTKIAEIKKTESKKEYVYDFAVKDNETFLAGNGGMFVHNTFTIANVINNTQKPALVIVANKTLAAQLYQEFKEFFPNNAVHYFVSYYDYYQPEAYLPSTDTYIEKDAKINEEIDQLRHAAVQDLAQRKDVIVMASVSCIYNIGSPQEYQEVSLDIAQGQKMKRQEFLRHLVALQYQRNDIDFKPGSFRVRGDTVEIHLVTGQRILRLDFFNDQVEKITEEKAAGDGLPLRPYASARSGSRAASYRIFPAKFWVSEEAKIKTAIGGIRGDLDIRLAELKKQNKLVEAQRLEQRTNYDLEMIQSAGYCSGIENYSRYFEFREPGSTPFCLLEHFPEDYLTIIDESHITVPQLHAMYNTDKARKNVLIEYGFRLPSCLDNRPLKFDEFEEKTKQTIYVSATPGPHEVAQAGRGMIVEQLVRPTGLLEPKIEIRATENQVKNLIEEIKKARQRNERILAVTLTKRMAEELAEYLKEQGIKAQYLHSEVKTLERPEILNKLRQGEYDVIIGINLLREGLDLPEVALVAILDADKEGFLRNETTLIQTMGRAARNLNGRVILYADKITGSMKAAIREVERRRKIQENYNKKHGIKPEAIIKEIKKWQLAEKEKSVNAELAVIKDVKLLEKEMKQAAADLDFERAAEIRDMISKMKQN